MLLIIINIFQLHIFYFNSQYRCVYLHLWPKRFQCFMKMLTLILKYYHYDYHQYAHINCQITIHQHQISTHYTIEIYKSRNKSLLEVILSNWIPLNFPAIQYYITYMHGHWYTGVFCKKITKGQDNFASNHFYTCTHNSHYVHCMGIIVTAHIHTLKFTVVS